VLIAQHMPPGFTKSFAQRLNGLCRIAVKEAEHGERVLPGHAYIAPGHAHLLLAQRRELHRAAVRRSAGEPPPAVGRRAVPLRRAARGQERDRRDPDRHGQGRRGRACWT
jgi:two-component system chemotaxis response regulator CheB